MRAVALHLTVAVAAMTFGYLLVSCFPAARALDGIYRWALAVAGLAGWALLLMVAHIATSGEVFSNPWVVRALTFAAVVTAGFLVRRGPRQESPTRNQALLAVGVVVLALLTWCAPVLLGAHFPTSADIHLHTGWTGQLLNGETTPSATITGDVPNYYPWLYHALHAFLSCFVPTNSAFGVLGALQLMLVVAGSLALFVLGRAVLGGAVGGALTAILAGIAGELTFPVARVAHALIWAPPDEAKQTLGALNRLAYHRSFNAPWHGLSPLYPRDLAIYLFVVLLIVLHRALRTGSTRLLTFSGLILGAIGLTGGEALAIAAPVSLIGCLISRKWKLRDIVLRLALPAMALYSLWFLPLAISYVRLGGFVNITTHIGGVPWSLSYFLGAWGLVLVLAIPGMVLAVRRAKADVADRLPELVVVSGLVMLVLAALMPAVLGEAFLSISRSYRYLTLLHIGVSLFAASFLVWVSLRATRSKGLLVGLLVVASLALVVPGLTASFAASRITSYKADTRPLELALDGSDESLLNALSELGESCNLAVPDAFSREVFSYTGHRLVSWVGKSVNPNAARIRWKGIYQDMPNGNERHVDNEALVRGRTSVARWEDLLDYYEVDAVVIRPKDAGRPVFSGLSGQRYKWDDELSFILFPIRDC